jgi:RNA polymerase sigma factor (sigma-70 family)
MSGSELWRTALRSALLDTVAVADADLLRRFHDGGDPAAFELLVYRHGRMVWAACRRIAGNHQLAEDAFQATFLALARRSGSDCRSVPAWLHRVAVRAAVNLVRRRRESLNRPATPEPMDPQPGPLECAAWAELTAAIDVAVDHLPERLRVAFVLCDLQGYSLKETAAQLACPVGTVESRLARARQRLRGALAGFRLAAGGVLATAAVPHTLEAATVQAAVRGGAVRPELSALADRAAAAAGCRRPASALAALAALLVTAGVLGYFQTPTPAVPTPGTAQASNPAPKEAGPQPGDGDLPPGALVRLGSTRFRHAGSARCEVAFSPSGQQLAAGDALGVSVFDTQTGKRLLHVPNPDGYSTRLVRFVAQGKQLAIASGNWQQRAELTLIELDTGKKLGVTSFAGQSQIFIIDITEDGKRVLVEDRFRKVYLWDTATGKALWEFDHPEASFTMPLTADGKLLVLAASRKAELHDALTGKVVGLFPTPGPKFGPLYHAAGMSPDGKLAVSSEEEAEIAILDARGDKAVRTFKADHQIHRLLFSPDGHYLIGLGPKGTLVWDTMAPAGSGPVARLPGAAHGGFSKDGMVLALDDMGYLSLWRVGKWTPLPQSAQPASAVHNVRFSADGKHVLGYTQAGWMRWPAGGGPGTPISDASQVFHEGVSQVSADGRVGADILCYPRPGRNNDKYALRVTDFATGKTRQIALKEPALNTLAVSPDGAFIYAFVGSELLVCDAAAGTVILREKRTNAGRFLLGAQPARDGKSVAWSVTGEGQDGREDPLAPAYKAVYLTHHGSKRELKLEPTPWSVYTAGTQFSDDGTMVMIQGRFNRDFNKSSVVIWDVHSGRVLLFWTRLGGRLEGVRLSPDGRSVAIGDGQGKLAIVEIASGQERVAFHHEGAIQAAAFHADGTRVVASSPEAPIYVWDLFGKAPKWQAAKTDALWADLAAADAKVAFTALRTLRANPAEAVAWLGDRVQVPKVPAAAKVAAWLKQLDSPKFAEREQAKKELTAVADLIQADLAEARKACTLEVAQRLDQILKSITDPRPEHLRHVRACEVVEGIGTAPALKLLQAWASGPSGARLTTEARASLTRLEQQGSTHKKEN